MSVSTREITLRGETVRYELERKSVKRINLRVRRDGSVYVSANGRVAVSRIEAFLRENAETLLSARERFTRVYSAENPAVENGATAYVSGEKKTLRIERGMKRRAFAEGDALVLIVSDPSDAALCRLALNAFYKERCVEAVARAMDALSQRFASLGVARPEIRFRSMTSRYGSCIPEKHTVTFNTALAGVPERLVELVVAHELSHFVEPNHSPAFYAVLRFVLPDCAERKRELDEKRWIERD